MTGSNARRRFAVATFPFFLAPCASAQEKPFFAEVCRAGITVECLFDEAVVLAGRLPSDEARLSRLRDIADAQIRAGRHVKAAATTTVALGIAKASMSLKARSYMFMRIAELYAQASDMRAARDTLSDALQAARETPDVNSRMSEFSAIVRLQIRFADRDGARASIREAERSAEAIPDRIQRGVRLRFVNELTLLLDETAGDSIEPYQRGNALIGAALLYAAAGDAERSRAFLSRAAATAENLRGSPFAPTREGETYIRSLLLLGIAEVQLRLNDRAAALSNAQRALADHRSVRRHSFDPVFAERLGQVFIRLDELSIAMTMVDALPERSAAAIHWAVARREMQQGNFELALKLAAGAEPRTRLEALCAMAEAPSARREDALKFLDEAKAVAASAAERSREVFLMRIARAYGAIGAIQEARTLTERSVDLARAQTDAWKRTMSLRSWAEVWLALRDQPAAERAAQETFEAAKLAHTGGGYLGYRHAAEVLALVGNLRTAREAALSIEDDDAKASALAWAATRFIEGAKHRQ